MRKIDFTKFLDSLEEKELRDELITLYQKFKDVKAHYSMELGSDRDRKRLFDKLKKDILTKYATRSVRRPKRPRISKIKALLKDAAKISVFKEEMADLHLYNCEQGLEFMEDYYFYSEPLFNNIVASFQEANNLIIASMTEDEYADRIDAILFKAAENNFMLARKLKGICQDQ